MVICSKESILLKENWELPSEKLMLKFFKQIIQKNKYGQKTGARNAYKKFGFG